MERVLSLLLSALTLASWAPSKGHGSASAEHPRIRVISVSPGGALGDGNSFSQGTATGTAVIVSEASNLDGFSRSMKAYVCAFGEECRDVTRQGSDEAGNDRTTSTDISPDGRYVVFASNSSNLVKHDDNGVADAFLLDRDSDHIELISRSSHGVRADGDTYEVSISEGAGIIAFSSAASNLVAGERSGSPGLYVYEKASDSVIRINEWRDGNQLEEGAGFSPVVSADGRFVAFSAIPAGQDHSRQKDIFAYSVEQRRVSRITHLGPRTRMGEPTYAADISADGRFVVYMSAAPSLVPRDRNDASDVFVYDRKLKSTERISVTSAGDEAEGDSQGGSISADGRYVVFSSYARNLVPQAHRYLVAQICIRDRLMGTTEIISLTAAGEVANDDNYGADISEDGRYVTFASLARNLVPNDNNRKSDVFVVDLARE